MAINKELLEKVKQHILEEPRRYDQSVYGKKSSEAPCGTAACIAGWTAILGGAIKPNEVAARYGEIRPAAEKLLGLTEGQADVLFHGDPSCDCGCGWPERYANRYEKAKTGRGRARAAADYIDFIIASGKVTE